MPDLNILGVVGTFAFGLLSILLYFRGKPVRRLSVQFTAQTFQRRGHPDVHLFYRTTEIDSLSRGALVCWNSGTRELRGADVPALAPIIFSLPKECRVLSTAVVQRSLTSNRFEVLEHPPNALQVTFDYLNPGEGALVEVLYDQHTPEGEPQCAIRGAVIGGTLSLSSGNDQGFLSDFTRRFLIGALGAFLGFGTSVGFGERGVEPGPLELLAGALAILVGVLLVEQLALRRRHRPPSFSHTPPVGAA